MSSRSLQACVLVLLVAQASSLCPSAWSQTPGHGQDARATSTVSAYEDLLHRAGDADAAAVADLLLQALATGHSDPVELYVLGVALRDKSVPPDAAGRPDVPPPGGKALRDKAARAADGLSRHADWRLRLLAAHLLTPYPAAARRAHQQLLQDREWPVRFAAIRALGACRDEASVETLRQILARGGALHVFERGDAIRALARAGHVPALVEALRNPDREVQLHAIWGLGRHRSLPDTARRALEDVLKTTVDREVREEIRKILTRPAAPAPEKPDEKYGR